MLIETLEVRIDKKQAVKMLNNKIPLMSKVVQLNKRIKNIRLQYIEYKVVSYKIIHKLNLKQKIFSKSDKKIDNITMLINTNTGYSFNTDNVPSTVKVNIEQTNLMESTINELHIINSIKNELIKNFDKKEDYIQDIKLINIKSIYIPFWVGFYDDKNIFIEAD